MDSPSWSWYTSSNTSSFGSQSQVPSNEEHQMTGYLRRMTLERGRALPVFRPPIQPGWARHIGLRTEDSIDSSSSDISTFSEELDSPSEFSDSTLHRAFLRAVDTVTHPMSRATFARLYDNSHHNHNYYYPEDGVHRMSVGHHHGGNREHLLNGTFSWMHAPMPAYDWASEYNLPYDADVEESTTDPNPVHSSSSDPSETMITAPHNFWQELINLRSDTSVSQFPQWFHIRPELSPHGEFSVQATRPYIRDLQGRLSQHSADDPVLQRPRSQ